MFNQTQIEQLLNIVDMQHILFIATNVGVDMLSETEIKLLEQAGVDIQSIQNTPFEEMFSWGLLSMSIGDKASRNLSYKKFKDYLQRGDYLPKTPVEKRALEVAKKQAASDLRGLGNRIKQNTMQVLIEYDQQQRAQYEKIVRESAVKTIKERGSIRDLVSTLGHKTQDWSRDFGRISDYVMHKAFEEGRASWVINEYGPDTLVYKKVQSGACKKCNQLYTTAGYGSKPKVFTIRELQANGSNIGRKVADWKPVVGPTHPWSLLDGRTLILTDNGWKQIKHINEGDMVLTHKKRFKRVISTVKNYPVPDNYPIKEYYTLQYYTSVKGKKKKQLRKMSFTAEHKILTQRGWVEIKDINAQKDKLYLLMTKCKNCNNLVEVYGKTNKLCSDKCRREYSAKLAKQIWERDDVEEIKDKISNTVKYKWENTNVYERTLNNLLSDKTKEKSRQRMLNGGAIKAMKAGSMPTSKIQIKLFNRVKKYFPSAVLEYQFNNKLLDIVIPEYKIDIEFDGPYHNAPDRIKADKERDKMLRENGWHIIRYSEFPKVDKLLSDIKLITDNHDKIYELKEIDIVKITKHKLTNKHRLWDIGVEDDESFIAKGIAVHNCRCMLVHIDPNYEWSDDDKDFTKPKEYTSKVKRRSRVKITIGDKTTEV